MLKEVAMHGPRGTRVAEVANALGLAYPTAYRMMNCLVAERMVERDEESRRYSLGPLVYELGLSVPPKMNLRDICDPVTSRVASSTGDTVFLNVRSGLDVLCIDRKEGTYPIKTLIFDVGSRRPLGVGAGGVALLMALPEAEVNSIMRANALRLEMYGGMTQRTITTLVRESRARGYVVTEDIVVRGVSAVSLPFGGQHGVPCAALTVACVPSRMPESRHRDLVSMLRTQITTLEKVLRNTAYSS
jgi:DNA-binding IclR family transcriptional regulator